MSFLRKLIFLTGLLFSNLFADTAISVSEKENIEYLFNHLFKFSNFSYTLFSDKPISFEEIYTPNTTNTSIKNYLTLLSYVTPINRFESSWNLWKSKFKDVQFDNYIFFDKKIAGRTTVILINKNAFFRTFEINKKIFQYYLGKDLTAENLLANILSDKNSLKESLGNYECLLGILLGYGVHNSKVFQKKQNITKCRVIVISKIIQDKLSEINKNLCAINQFFGWINVIQPIRFMAISDHPESKRLIEKYSSDNTMLSKIYKNGNVVDIIIEKLSE